MELASSSNASENRDASDGGVANKFQLEQSEGNCVVTEGRPIAG